MKKKRSDSRIITALLVALALESGLLLLHLGMVSVGHSNHSGDRQAGTLVKEFNQVRRRAVDSLVWEKSLSDEPVYYDDSILTLNQSTATIKLDGQTEINLSENTLMTIEPPTEKQGGEIRLRFERGSLRARNPFHSTAVAASDGAFTVNLKKGSDVDFRKVGDSSFEVHLLGGEAVVESPQGKQKIQRDELLKIDHGATQRLEMAADLSWVSVLPGRVYTHADQTELPLAWNGDAQMIVVQTLGQGERTIATGTDHRMVLTLPIGQHRLYLRKGHLTSQSVDVQVWRAPVVQLLRPLPRDRVKLDDQVQFLWMQDTNLAAYKLHFETGAGSATEISVHDNEFTQRLPQTGDFRWTIYGVDKDGYIVPPLYSYPLYVRDRPFEAPQLKSPAILRQPAGASVRPKKGASFWWKLENLLWPQANAAEVEFEAVFEWEKVQGADQYVIEISPTDDFRSPVVSKTVKPNRFVWRGFALKTYYWRVAAASSTGRMGLFSTPAAIDLKTLADTPQAIASVFLRRIKTEKPLEKKKPLAPLAKPLAPPPRVSAQPPAPRAPSPVQERAQRWFAWRPQMTWSDFKVADAVHARLNGGTSRGFAVEAPWAISSRPWLLDLSFAQTKFKPHPEEAYPFQGRLTWNDLRATALCFDSWWGYGAEARESFSVERTGYESIGLNASVVFGPAIGIWTARGSWQYSGTASALIGSGRTQVELFQQMRFGLWKAFWLGGGVEGVVEFSGGGTSSVVNAFGLMGFEF